MDAYELIISVCALNSRFSQGFYYNELYQRIIKSNPNKILDKERIRPDPMHNHSETLSNAFCQLLANRVFKQWVPDNYWTWNLALSQQEYFNRNIKPRLNPKELKDLEALVHSMN